MIRIFLILFCMSFLVNAKAQRDYGQAIKQGDEAYEKQYYKIAIDKYFAAEAFDPTKKNEVKKKVNHVFDKIESLKREAEASSKEARIARERAVKNADDALSYKLIWKAKNILDKDPTLALRLAENAVAKNDDITLKQEEYRIYNQYSFYRIIDSSIYNPYATYNPYAQDQLTVCGENILITKSDYEYHLLNSEGNLVEKLSAISVTFSSHGDTLLICDKRGRLYMRDLTGQMIDSLQNNGTLNVNAKILPNGQHILARTYGNYRTNYQLLDLKGNIITSFDNASSIAYSGDTIITGSIEGIVRLFNLKGELIQELKGHKKEIHWVAIYPNDNQIISSSKDTTFLWNSEGKKVKGFNLQKKSIKDHEFSPDGQNLLVSFQDSTAVLLRKEEDSTKVFRDNSKNLLSAKFSYDGKTILTGSKDGIARLYDLEGNLKQEFRGHTEPINSVAFLPDGKTIVTYSQDGTLRLWDLKGLATSEAFAEHTGKVQAVAFAPSCNLFASGSNDTTIRVWNRNGEMIRVLRGHQAPLGSVVFSPNEQYILSGADDSIAILWNLEGDSVKVFKGHTGVVHSAVFSPTGDTVLTGSHDGTARIWDLKGDLLRKFDNKGFDKRIHAVDFSPDGQKIVAGDWGGDLSLWSIDGDSIIRFKAHEQGINTVKFSPDGGKIFSGGWQGKAILWNTKGEEIITLQHNRAVNSVAFSPDGKSLLTGVEDNTFNIWDLQGISIQELKGHTDVLNSVAFSPDGKKILTGSNDKTIRIWDVNRTLQDFLNTGNLHPLTEKQKDEYGIK